MSTAKLKVKSENCLESTNVKTSSTATNNGEAVKMVFHSAVDVRNNLKCDSDDRCGIQKSNTSNTSTVHNYMKDNKSKNELQDVDKVIKNAVSSESTFEEPLQKKQKGQLNSKDDLKGVSMLSSVNSRYDKFDPEDSSGLKNSYSSNNSRDSKINIAAYEDHNLADIKRSSMIGLRAVRRAAYHRVLDKRYPNINTGELKINDDCGYVTSLKNSKASVVQREGLRHEERKVDEDELPSNTGLQSVHRASRKSSFLEKSKSKKDKRVLRINDESEKTSSCTRVTRSQTKRRADFCRRLSSFTLCKDAGDCRKNKLQPVNKNRRQLKRRPGVKVAKAKRTKSDFFKC